MKSKVIVITGASDGIGLAAAKELNKQGHEIVIVGRSPEKTKAAAQELDTLYYIADFAKLDEVRRLASELKQKYPRIDVLVNNAGGLFGDRELTVDGYEKTMQVNHLAGFLLTNLLLDTLITSKATIINTSSRAAKIFAKLDIDDINMANDYTPRTAYGNAKLENILFTKELNRRYGNKGINAVCFHPGNVSTSFASDTNDILRFMYHSPLKIFAGLISPEKGADTLVWLATTTPQETWQLGGYYVRRKIAKTNPIAVDESVAKSLWDQSVQMTKL